MPFLIPPHCTRSTECLSDAWCISVSYPAPLCVPAQYRPPPAGASVNLSDNTVFRPQTCRCNSSRPDQPVCSPPVLPPSAPHNPAFWLWCSPVPAAMPRINQNLYHHWHRRYSWNHCRTCRYHTPYALTSFPGVPRNRNWPTPRFLSCQDAPMQALLIFSAPFSGRIKYH